MAFFRFAFSQNSGIIIILLFFLFVPQNVYLFFAASNLLFEKPKRSIQNRQQQFEPLKL